ncbi:Cdc25 phosphatase Ibp1 [Lithohypha guttulata]|uniref:Cdc25 phosphatase Ibp1 n=1 Tax=Lithohypha guttulata TaxID=1690604 RepID=A0AAN7Y4A1_9EURO|nr:Cdc25 phosphatase Ibp1 [Lithohypha guttulata]
MSSTKAASITLSSLKYIKPVDLANSLQDAETSSKVAIIDVRDNDHVGGNIRGSQWVPINQLDARMPELLRTNQDRDRVVFHCMLSQQRGPKAALAYARARAYQAEKEAKGQGKSSSTEEEKTNVEGNGKVYGQEVCVLEGGFGAWQSSYAEDETLTADYVEDLWE